MGAEGPDLQGLDRVLEVVARARGAGEVQHRVDWAVDGDELRDVVLDELEAAVLAEVLDVVEACR